jgi:hypothetical protein
MGAGVLRNPMYKLIVADPQEETGPKHQRQDTEQQSEHCLQCTNSFNFHTDYDLTRQSSAALPRARLAVCGGVVVIKKEGIAPGSVGFSDWLGHSVTQPLLALVSSFLVSNALSPPLPTRRCPMPLVHV